MNSFSKKITSFSLSVVCMFSSLLMPLDVKTFNNSASYSITETITPLTAECASVKKIKNKPFTYDLYLSQKESHMLVKYGRKINSKVFSALPFIPRVICKGLVNANFKLIKQRTTSKGVIIRYKNFGVYTMLIDYYGR